MTDPKPTYRVGDVVAVTRRNGLSQRTVAAVRSYKRRTKVTLNDGSEWCAKGGPWNSEWPTMRFTHMTPDLQAQLYDQVRKAAVSWVADNWDSLPADVREQIGNNARGVKRDYLRDPSPEVPA